MMRVNYGCVARYSYWPIRGLNLLVAFALPYKTPVIYVMSECIGPSTLLTYLLYLLNYLLYLLNYLLYLLNYFTYLITYFTYIITYFTYLITYFTYLITYLLYLHTYLHT